MQSKEKVKEEVVLIRYYNVLFFLTFRKNVDEIKKDIIIKRVEGGEKMNMKTIYNWCIGQKIPIKMKFRYRKDFSIAANIWNLYSFCRFQWGARIRKI